MLASESEPRLVLRTDRRSVVAGSASERYLVIDVVAPRRERDPVRSRPPANIAIVLDRSGSMGASAKLPLAKTAIGEALGRLEEGDRFSVVVYDDRVDVVQAGADATHEARRRVAARLADVGPRNATDLGAGWLAGCEQVAAALQERGVNRVLLLTDGLANRGMTSPEELSRHASELRARGVCTSTFGLGLDFDEQLLQSMADAGGGHFYFIETAAQIRDVMTSEVGEALDVVARDVAVEVALPQGAEVGAISPFPTRSENGMAVIEVGDMVSGQEVRLILRVMLDAGAEGEQLAATARASDRDGAFAGAQASIAWTSASAATCEAQDLDADVLHAAAKLIAAAARQEAVPLNRRGRYEEARRVLVEAARRLAAMPGGDARISEIVAALEQAAESMERPMPESSRKLAYRGASYDLRSRLPDGRSSRRSD